MEKIAAPRGTADIYPPESARWQALEAEARAVARRFGYGEIRTPMFESTDLFVRGVGETTDIVEKEMYTFQDKGGRSLTLRPEWTAPVVRAVLEHNLLANGPQRLFYIGPMFRYERPQAGRYRQAHQFGVESFGFAAPEADVEVIALAYELMRAHDLERHRERQFDRRRGVPPALSRGATRALRAASRDACRRIRSGGSNAIRCASSIVRRRKIARSSRAAPTMLDVLCEPCAEHFAAVRALLDAIGVPYVVDPRIVRGLDYYTRTVFELISSELGAQATVCARRPLRRAGRVARRTADAGRRLRDGTRTLPDAARKACGPRLTRTRSGIAVVALGDAARRRVMPLVAALRRASGDLAITIDYGDAKIALQFKKADRANARAAIVVGRRRARERSRRRARSCERAFRIRSVRTATTRATAADVLRWYGAPARASECGGMTDEADALRAMLDIMREHDLDALTVRVGEATYELVARIRNARRRRPRAGARRDVGHARRARRLRARRRPRRTRKK